MGNTAPKARRGRNGSNNSQSDAVAIPRRIPRASRNRSGGSANSTSNNSASNSSPQRPSHASAEPITATPATQATVTGPGAHAVGGGEGGAATTVFRVNMPPGVQPGDEFQVYAGSRLVRVRCPADVRANQSLQITVPAEPNGTPVRPAPPPPPSTTTQHNGGPVGNPIGGGRPSRNRGGRGPAPSPQQQHQQTPNSTPGVRSVASSPSSAPAFMVPIPAGIEGGQQFPVIINSQQLMVTCPPNARGGMSVRIVPPPQENGPSNSQTPEHATPLTRAPEPRPPVRQQRRQAPAMRVQMFEVVVPPGARSGQSFALMAGGQRVLVTCPNNAVAGQRVRFQLPLALTQKPKGQRVPDVKLSYDKDGWTRTIRVTDMKFTWVRMDDKGDVDQNKRFDPKTAAYVRKIDFYESSDPRMRAGKVSLAPAAETYVDSRIRGTDGQDIVTYADIANAQRMTFDDKAQWFQDTCASLCVEWNEGHMRMNVRREFLLNDSMEAVMSLSRKDLRKVWRFEFIGEAGIDAGGLAREWFQIVTEEVFDPDNGLWESSATNQMSMQINPCSEIACPDAHLVYFRFLGRVMGKALFDRQLVAGHMVRHLYKHILGWPVMFDDLKLIDEEYYNNMKKILEYSAEELEMMCLDFTSTEQTMGVVEEVELVEGGSDIEVTIDNLPEYMEACLKYRMLGRIKNQLTELLLGFFDVIPEPLLTVFDFQELELLMCGLPNIDMDDWKANTLYTGDYDRTDGKHRVCRWFWEVVEEEFDDELKARLLQFVTGTSGVPSRGFSVLQGNDGNIRKFTIHGVQLEQCLYPRAHTCFNRIDLPIYKTKQDLLEKLKLAVQMEATGFDIE
mmetsp:Transcript_4676/g.5928  ORF Transcript_4676/g.5928 Transcript_4676/m.5928 type:complete len:844 (-) Transcript_4676:425-2956(-)